MASPKKKSAPKKKAPVKKKPVKKAAPKKAAPKPPTETQLDFIRNRETPERSVRWYQDMIRKVGLNQTTAREQIDQTDLGILTTKLLPGDMYLYIYDPKTKDALPYYDTAPLVLPFKYSRGGFTGLNLHYLPPLLRLQLLNKLFKFATTPNLTNSTRLRLKWSLLKNASEMPEVIPCIKRYLYSHVRSRFLLVNPTDWRKAVVLPLDNFVKKSNQYVWRESRKRIEKGWR